MFREGAERVEELLVAAFPRTEAQLVHFLLSALGIETGDVDAVESAKQERALLAQTTVDQRRATLRITAQVEELAQLETRRGVFVVAGDGYELNAEGIAGGSLGLLPGVWVGRIAGAAEADDRA